MSTPGSSIQPASSIGPDGSTGRVSSIRPGTARREISTSPGTPTQAARARRRPAPVTSQGPDLRLAGFVAGTWLAIIAAVRMPSGDGVRLALSCAAAAALSGYLAGRRVGRHRSVFFGLAAVLLGAGCGSAVAAAHTAVRDAGPVRSLVAAQAEVRADLTLTADPHLSQSSTPGRQIWVAPATLHRMTPDPPDRGAGVRLRAPALILGLDAAWNGLLPGQRVVVHGKLSPPRERDLTVAVVVVDAAPQLSGRPPWYQRAAGGLRAGLRRACRGLPGSTDGLLPALVDGDVSKLDARVQRDFLAAGMTYIVVVSGAHLTIVLGCVLCVAGWLRLRPWPRAAVGAVAVVAFVVLARPAPSMVRAAVMASLGLVAAGTARPRGAVPALLASIFVLLVANPEFGVQIGFALSTLATAGLLLLVPTWRDRLTRRGVPAPLATALAIPLAAQLACAPVIAAMSGVVGVAAIPANILADAVVAPATLLGLAATLAVPLSPGVAHALAWLGAWPCWWLVVVAHAAARMPAGLLPWPTGLSGGLFLALVLLIGLAVFALRPRLVVAATVLLLVLLAVDGVSGVPQSGRSVPVTDAPPSRASPCQARRGPLPDPSCTPGAINPEVTPATIERTICHGGWSATVRPPSDYTNQLKRQQIGSYGYVDQSMADYEEDHLVPLSLGGAPSDPRNLWPEPGASPNPKDDVEAALQAAVCNHEVSLASAQQAIATDWTSALQRLGL